MEKQQSNIERKFPNLNKNLKNTNLLIILDY